MADHVVVDQHERVGEAGGVQIDVPFEHIEGIDAAGAGGGVALAPGAERAHVDKVDQRMAVIAPSILGHEVREMLEIDRIAVVRLDRAHGKAARARVEHPPGRGVGDHVPVRLIGTQPHGEAIAQAAPMIDDRVELVPLIAAALRLDVVPVEAQIQMVEPGKGAQVVAGLYRVAVGGGLHAVVDIVEIPALVRVGQHGAVVLKSSKVAVEER